MSAYANVFIKSYAHCPPLYPQRQTYRVNLLVETVENFVDYSLLCKLPHIGLEKYFSI